MRAHVVGLGLVGSSIALGLSERGHDVSGEDLDSERAERALELGVVDALELPEHLELAFVATPASSVVTEVRRLLEARPGTDGPIVTDVAGSKAAIATAVGDPRFVPGHPMAGSEQEGPDGADPDLFVGATWVLTPTATTSERAYAVVHEAISSLGADVVVLEPDRHDDLVAVVSHVPHLTSATLMSLASESSVDREVLLRLAAGGFRDMTRIAAGSSSIWPDVCSDNAGAIVPVLDRLVERLVEVRRIVAGGERERLVALLESARAARRDLPARGERPAELSELRVVVPDRPGVLAQITSLAGSLGVNIYDIEIAHSTEGPRGVLLLLVATADGPGLTTTLRGAGFKVAAAAGEGTGVAR